MSLEQKRRKPRWDLLGADLMDCYPRVTSRHYGEAELQLLTLLDSRPVQHETLFNLYEWCAGEMGLDTELDALEAVVEVLTNGAQKYPDHGWKEISDAEKVYFSALCRHLKAYVDGEESAPDSGLPHLSHVMCNCVILSWHLHKQNRS